MDRPPPGDEPPALQSSPSSDPSPALRSPPRQISRTFDPDRFTAPAQRLAPSDEPAITMASRIAARFDVERPIETFDFTGKGNIHRDTFLLECGSRRQDSAAGPTANASGSTRREYLLQRVNEQVFRFPRQVLASMIACLDAQRAGIAAGRAAGRRWEPITLVGTRAGEPYLERTDRRGTSYWRLMVRIPDCVTYKSLAEIESREGQLRTAEEAGRGLALFLDLTDSMDVESLENPFPGYRDTELYFDQLESVLAGHRTTEAAEELLPEDPLVRASSEDHFKLWLDEDEARKRREDPDVARWIELARESRELALRLAKARAAGSIRTVATHGDTKLENFLFDAATGEVKSLVDLDTILPQTWLADWGDLVRSLSNVAGEKERDPSRVRVDLDIYRAVARGFLSIARSVREEEIALMTDAVRIIALELGVRFLTDYLRGDNYFRLGPADPVDLNRVRARVQFQLFEELAEVDGELRAEIEKR